MKPKAYKYFPFLFIAVATVVLAQPAKSSPGKILTAEERKKTTQNFQAFIDANLEAETSDIDFGKILPPFLFDFPPERTQQEEKPQVEEPVVKYEKPPLSEEDLVKQIGTALKPRGSILQGNTRVLFVHGNRKMVVGDKLRIKHREKEHVIEIITIEPKFFELKLNNTTERFNY